MGLQSTCRALNDARLLSRELSPAMRETSGALECLAPGLEVRLFFVRIAEVATYTASVQQDRVVILVPRGHLYLM